MCTRSPLGPGHFTFAVVAIRAWPRGNYWLIEPWTEFIVAASSGGALSFVVSDITGGIVPFVLVGVCFFSKLKATMHLFGSAISMAIRDFERGCLARVRSILFERITLHHTPRTTLTVQWGRRLSPYCTRGCIREGRPAKDAGHSLPTGV